MYGQDCAVGQVSRGLVFVCFVWIVVVSIGLRKEHHCVRTQIEWSQRDKQIKDILYWRVF